MSKAKKKIIEVAKLPTKAEAAIMASDLIQVLLEKDCKFNFYCRFNFFQFLGVYDYQLIKHHFPQFEIKFDDYKTAYVEYIINYEQN